MTVRMNIGRLGSVIEETARIAATIDSILSSLNIVSPSETISGEMTREMSDLADKNPFIVGIHRIGDRNHFVV